MLLRSVYHLLNIGANLYEEGLQVYGWRLNGGPENFDSFYNLAMECLGL